MTPGDDDLLQLGPSDEPAYACGACGETYDEEHYLCPACGEFAIDRRPIDS
ncbi:hypothetical protein [Salinirarus marinus]|uniref:hypothetical protein n=1 Tax=Salinirarus marinus TaxID=3068310 RepID=UPI003C6BE44F